MRLIENGCYPILYFTKELSDTEKMIGIKKECFAIIWSVKFHGVSNIVQFEIYQNHGP
jgi:hypothetical protein